MNTNILSESPNKRWSKPFEDKRLSEMLGNDYSNVHLSSQFLNLEGLALAVAGTARNMKESGFAPYVCHEKTEEFYLDGWDSGSYEYSGLYSPTVSVVQELHDALFDLTYYGYNVKQQWKEYKGLIHKLWQSLPDLYQGDTRYKINKPKDYDPNKPFPNLPIPEDID